MKCKKIYVHPTLAKADLLRSGDQRAESKSQASLQAASEAKTQAGYALVGQNEKNDNIVKS